MKLLKRLSYNFATYIVLMKLSDFFVPKFSFLGEKNCKGEVNKKYRVVSLTSCTRFFVKRCSMEFEWKAFLKVEC